RLARQPKPIIGYSDATALLGAAVEVGVLAVHGPMVADDMARGLSERSATHLQALLTDPAWRWEAEAPITLRPGKATGRLVGGCLAVLAAVLGTPWAPDTAGTILFLEDVAERPYRLDRLLTQLRQAGKLERVAGPVFGTMAAFPGAVILVSRAGRVLYHAAFGCRSLEPARAPMQPDTIFDLSSLTKPLATTTAFMLLVKERKVQVDDRVTRFFHNFGVHGKTHVTFRHLLAHCSGLPGCRPFAREIERIEREGRLNFIASRGAKEWVYEQINRERPEYELGARS